MTKPANKIISAKTKSSAKPRRITKSSAHRVAAHDARKTASGQKLVRVWVHAEHAETLRHYAQSLNASRPGARAGLIKAAAWAPGGTLENLSEYTSGTIYAAPGPLLGMVPLYTIETLAALLQKGVK